MRFLITGAAGFIGSHLADRLVAAGHGVCGVDNFTTSNGDNYTITNESRLYEIDICDRHALYDLANDLPPDVVVHCAASYSDPNLWHRDTDTNVAGTINAINVARHHDARLVYFQTALPPISSYAISKIAGEQYIALSGVPSLVFRLANIYGPRNLSGPIPTFYRRLTAGEPCTIVDTRRDMVYVSDLIDAVVHALDIGAEGKFDMCSGSDYPISQLFSAVAYATGTVVDTPTVVPAPPDDVKQMELNPHRATVALGWVPDTPLADGVAAAVEWYSAHGVENTYTHLKIAS